MRIGNLCVTRKNMGDSLMLPIPYTVNIAEARSEYCYSQSQKCCWKGTTGVNCDSNNGGYSGCTRTVCNWEAAKEICAKFNYAGKTWRLPTPDEAQNWFDASLGLAQNGMMLCNHASNDANLAKCNDSDICQGAYLNACYPRAIFTNTETSNDTVYTYGFSQKIFLISNHRKNYADSVRCVTEME